MIPEIFRWTNSILTSFNTGTWLWSYICMIADFIPYNTKKIQYLTETNKIAISSNNGIYISDINNINFIKNLSFPFVISEFILEPIDNPILDYNYFLATEDSKIHEYYTPPNTATQINMYSQSHGLGSNEITSLLLLPNGNLWVGNKKMTDSMKVFEIQVHLNSHFQKYILISLQLMT